MDIEDIADNDTSEYHLVKTIKRLFQLNLFNRITLLMMYSLLFPILVEHEENELFDLYTVFSYMNSICKTKQVWTYVGPYEAQRLESPVLDTIRDRTTSITNYLVSYLEKCVEKGTDHYEQIKANSIFLQLQQIYHETKSILMRDYNYKILNIINIWEVLWKNEKLTNATVVALTIVALPSMESHSEKDDKLHRAKYIFDLLSEIPLKKKNRMHKTKFYSKIVEHMTNIGFKTTTGDGATKIEPTKFL